MKSLIAWSLRLLAFSLVAATPLAAALPKKPPARALPAKANWLATANRTAEGAIVIGNPAAKVKLIEYLSLTCSHCADLSASVMPPLQRDYIAKGLVSLEVRHAVRDGYDFAASLLLRCEPPAQYLRAIEALFAIQSDWIAKGSSVKATPGFDAMSPDQKIAAVARAAGLDAFFARRGMPAKAYAACLADAKAKDELTEMAGNSWQRDAISGTPLIVINGTRQAGLHGWSDLEPLIKAALTN